MILEPVASGRLRASTLERLDRHADEAFGCNMSLARVGGVHVISSPRRALPAWHGFALPMVALVVQTGAVVAARPGLADELLIQMGSDVREPCLNRTGVRRLYRAVQRLLPHAYVVEGDLRAVDGDAFQPHRTEHRADLIPRNDPAAMHLRSRFDGEIFAVRGPRGILASWAALKLKSDDVWEIAVATERDYRGRGFARDVVSAATRFTLDQGRLCTYIHDRENSRSAFVCRSLGYRLYAEIVLAEY